MFTKVVLIQVNVGKFDFPVLTHSHPQPPTGKKYSNIVVVFICGCSVICPEAATWRGSINKVFLKFLQNSQENTFVIHPSTLLKYLPVYRLFDFENRDLTLNF